jgi:hypothetical protein
MKVAFLAAAVLAATGVVSCFATPIDAAKTSGPKPAARDVFALKALPLFFEPNQGQSAAQVKFLARGAGYGLFLTANETVLQLQSSALSSQDPSSLVIRMRLDGANASARVSGASLLPGKSSYFIGDDASKWRRDIPHFARVQYQAVYPGVDLIYYGNQGQLEYDFRVAPGADPNRIALSFDGATAQIDPAGSGDLLLSTGSGEVRFHAPRVYQPGQPAAPGSGNSSANTEKAVAGQFRQLAVNIIGPELFHLPRRGRRESGENRSRFRRLDLCCGLDYLGGFPASAKPARRPAVAKYPWRLGRAEPVHCQD